MSLMLKKWILNSIMKSQPAKKPIVQVSRVESFPDDSQLQGHFKLACISDREKFIRAVFTRDSLAVHEERGTSLDNIRGEMISLQDYAMIASVGTDKRFSEYFVEVHKFSYIGGERNMPIPMVTNINLDENIQSKLAQLWREKHADDSGDDSQHSALVVYSQMEEALQLSHIELSMLLGAMSEQSQVDSIEAISSSQMFELENIPGWLKPDDTQLREQSSTQETNYATPLLSMGETYQTAISITSSHDTSNSSHDPLTDSHDTPASTAFKTPPEGVISPLVAKEGVNQSQAQQMIDNEEPLDLTAHSTSVACSGEAIQEHTASAQQFEGMNDVSEVLQEAVRNAAEVITQSIPRTANGHKDTNNEETISSAYESPTHDGDNMDITTEISGSQVKELSSVWAKEQPLLHSTINRTMEEQPFNDGSDILPASDTPSNDHDCNDNDVSSNGCSEQKTAASIRQQGEDKQRDKQLQNHHQQQFSKGKRSLTDKGKGGTTKDIYLVGEHVNTANGIAYDHHNDAIDDDISISSSQRDELDRVWVAAADDDEMDHMSALETVEDLHPFQLASLPHPSNSVVDQTVTEDEPGPSGTMDTFVLNQEAVKKRKVVNEDDMDTPDRQLLSQADTTTSSTAKVQTSLLSTAAITRLLDVSNKAPPMRDAVGTRTIPQSFAATGNTRMTPSRTMTSHHDRTLQDNSTSNPQDLVTDKDSVITTRTNSDVSTDVIHSKERLNDQTRYHFRPLTSEEDIDEFIDNYWMLQQLRTFSF